MAKNILTKSKTFNPDYSASVIRVGELTPLPNADKLEKTIINGSSFVIEKGTLHTGDIAFYVENECELNEQFLSVNNQFDMSERSRNANADEVEALLEPALKIKDEIKKDKAYIEKLKKIIKKIKERKALVDKIERMKNWLAENKAEYERLLELDSKEEVVKVTEDEQKLFEDYKKTTTNVAKKENVLTSFKDVKDKTVEEFQQMIDEINAQLDIKRANYDELAAKVKPMIGYFTKQKRIKMIRLRECPSYGYLFGIEAMKNFCPEIADVNLEELVGTDFDTVNGELFCKMYLPPVKETHHSSRGDKRQKKVKKFDRMIPGEFKFHYDTVRLNKTISDFSPEDEIEISTKVHGTSCILGNIKCKFPKEFHTFSPRLNKWLQKMYLRFVPEKLQTYTIDYGNVCSSRTVVKNAEYNPEVGSGYYKVDIWTIVNDVFKGFIDKGMTVYGEIVGYIPKENENGQFSMIQRNYDYGCKPGEWKFMPYRITTEIANGAKYEWTVSEVLEWTEKLINEHPEVSDKVMLIQKLYTGKFCDLYPEIPIDIHWHENVLEAMKVDKRFGMEMMEELCTEHQVPREGIVIRYLAEGSSPKATLAYKLKTDLFWEWEKGEIDAGVMDVEMTEANRNDSDDSAKA